MTTREIQCFLRIVKSDVSYTGVIVTFRPSNYNNALFREKTTGRRDVFVYFASTGCFFLLSRRIRIFLFFHWLRS